MRPGDDVDRRPLRREDQVDAGGARLLRDPRDQLLDLLAGHHHQVGELVDDDDDDRHLLERLGRVRRQRERVAERRARLLRFADLRVVAAEIAHAERRHQPVAALHLGDAPVERVAGELHVGDDRREQVRDAFVDRKLEHLRVDEDQAHLPRLRLVEQRQDHRVDRHRLPRAGRAGDEQVRHPREIGDHGLPRDVLAERERQRAHVVVVRRRRQDLDELHDLPLRIGELEPHARLAGDRLDDADRDDRQRAREVLHQVDDLRALDADRRLDLVARDHRPGIRGEHLHRDAEVRELALDQARRELERLRAHHLLRRRRVVEQRERRQRRVRHVDEERPLLLLHDTVGFRHVERLRNDDDRLALDDIVLRLDDCLAHGGRLRAHFAVPALFRAAPHARDHAFEARTDALHQLQPRDAEEERRSRGKEREQQQRRAVEAEQPGEPAPDRIAERAPRRERQGSRSACRSAAPRARRSR